MERYKVGKMIGKGSFGEVFLSSERRSGKEFVMKKMRLVNVPGWIPEIYHSLFLHGNALSLEGIDTSDSFFLKKFANT